MTSNQPQSLDSKPDRPTLPCRFALMACWMLLSCTWGCSDKPPRSFVTETTEPTRPRIIATSLFLYEVAQHLVADSADVVFLCNDVPSPMWEPDAQQVKELQNASLIVLNGANFEPWRSRLSLPRSRLLDTSAGFTDKLLTVEGIQSHQHGPTGETEGGELAWATWLDPSLAIAQIREVESAINNLMSTESEAIASRAEELIDSISDMEESLRSFSTKTDGWAVHSSSPQLCYLTRKAGWEMVLSSEDFSTPDGQTKLSQLVARRSLKLFLVASSRDSRELLQAKGQDSDAQIPIVELDLCLEQRSQAATTLERMQANITAIQNALATVE